MSKLSAPNANLDSAIRSRLVKLMPCCVLAVVISGVSHSSVSSLSYVSNLISFIRLERRRSGSHRE